MRFALISDNHDTQTGLRLAGIEGVVVHERDEVIDALSAAMADRSVAVVLITEKLVDMCRTEVYDMKLSHASPLIVEIPDRHGDGRSKDSIMKYINDAIGIKI
ncbi:MAG: V-type ATP synthase subunit F [Firmicutes bacterium]|nr:V-type ATP synthase subunit F [Bacillota bacterium]